MIPDLFSTHQYTLCLFVLSTLVGSPITRGPISAIRPGVHRMIQTVPRADFRDRLRRTLQRALDRALVVADALEVAVPARLPCHAVRKHSRALGRYTLLVVSACPMHHRACNNDYLQETPSP